MEPVRKLRRKYFFCICRRNGRHLVRTYYGAFHKIYAAVVFEHFGVGIRDIEHVAENGHVVYPLILDIMYCKYGLNARIFRDQPVFIFKINHGERRLPVVRVKDVRHEIYALE